MAVASVEPHDHQRALNFGMMGFFIFLASEFMFFGALFAMYAYMVGSHGVWPPPGTRAVNWAPIPAINTVILLSSGLTMHMGMMNIEGANPPSPFRLAMFANRRRGLIFWLCVTIVLGATFEALQVWEFTHARIAWSYNTFSSAFFTITGFHGAHVFGGLVLLSVVLIRALRGQFSARHHTGVNAVAIYWHFVDVVWLFVFTTLYLLVTFGTGAGE